MSNTAHIYTFSQKLNNNLIWDISQSNLVGSNDVSVSLSVGFIPSGLFVNNLGTMLFVFDENTNEIYQFDFNSDWDITSLAFNKKSNVLSTINTALGIRFSSDGTKVFVMDSIADGNDNSSIIHCFSLSTAWDVSTLNINSINTMSLTRTSGKEWFDKDFSFSYDGSFVYYLYASNDIYDISNTTFLRVYKLNTPFDLSSITTIGSGALSKSLAFDSDAQINRVAQFNKDGTAYNWDVSVSDLTNTYFLACQPLKIDHRDTTFNKTKLFDGLNNLKIDFPNINRFYAFGSDHIIKQYNTNFFNPN